LTVEQKIHIAGAMSVAHQVHLGGCGWLELMGGDRIRKMAAGLQGDFMGELHSQFAARPLESSKVGATAACMQEHHQNLPCRTRFIPCNKTAPFLVSFSALAKSRPL